METPGINTEPFELLFEEDYFKLNDWLMMSTECWIAPWYIRIFGFKFSYEVKILDSPIVQDSGHWRYKVQLTKKYLYWFNFKVWDYGKVS